MWPWEHLAVAYVLYSLGRRSLGVDPPDEAGMVAVVVGSQFPDLIDKPLSWGLGLFPSGFAVAHSALLALPVGVAVVVLSRRAGSPTVGVAFVVAYWSHLLADVVSPLRSGAALAPGRVLWPLVTGAPYETDYGFARGVVYLDRFVAGLGTTSPAEAVVFFVALPLATLGLWLADGAPGLALLGRVVAPLRR